MSSVRERLRYRAQSLLKFYNPYTRLQLRAQIESWLQAHGYSSTIPPHIDFPALFEAVVKRGYLFSRHSGLLQAKLRAEEIALSLPYYDTTRIGEFYRRYVIPIEAILLRDLPGIQVAPEPLVEQHCLPLVEGHHYYELGDLEKSFALDNFASLDEFFCLKTLVLMRGDRSKLSPAHAEKYDQLQKWMQLRGDMIVRDRALELAENLPKVCIVGLNLPNLLLARKLARVGIPVKVVEPSFEKLSLFGNQKRDAIR